jgi:hypothetical protein
MMPPFSKFWKTATAFTLNRHPACGLDPTL